MAAWLDNVGYPGVVEASFLEDCIRWRVELHGDTAAYVWAHWWRENPDARVLIMHACCAPEYRGRWLDPLVADRVFGMCAMLGAHGVFTEPFASSNRDGRLTRLYRHLGFTQLGEGGFYLTL